LLGLGRIPDRSNNPNVVTNVQTCTGPGAEGATLTLTVTTIPFGRGTPYQITVEHGNIYPKFLSITGEGETFVIFDRPGDVPADLAVTCTGHLAGTPFDLYLEGFKTP